jgi:hypothetical protein
MDSLLCFGFMFLLQGVFIAAVMSYFNDLSKKRRQGTITEDEKWLQGLISLPAMPVLEVVLQKDQVGMRWLLTLAVVVSFVLTMLFIPNLIVLLVACLVLIGAIWLSLSL